MFRSNKRELEKEKDKIRIIKKTLNPEDFGYHGEKDDVIGIVVPSVLESVPLGINFDELGERATYGQRKAVELAQSLLDQKLEELKDTPIVYEDPLVYYQVDPSSFVHEVAIDTHYGKKEKFIDYSLIEYLSCLQDLANKENSPIIVLKSNYVITDSRYRELILQEEE